MRGLPSLVVMCFQFICLGYSHVHEWILSIVLHMHGLSHSRCRQSEYAKGIRRTICTQMFEDFHISARHLNLFQNQCWRQNQRKQWCSLSTRDTARLTLPNRDVCSCDKQVLFSELCEFSVPTQFVWSVSGSVRGTSIWICKNGIQPWLELKMQSEIDVKWKCNRKHTQVTRARCSCRKALRSSIFIQTPYRAHSIEHIFKMQSLILQIG